MNKWICFISGGLFLLSPLSASALDLSENSEVHGFAMQSYVYSPDNPYYGSDSTDGSFDYREMGLNGFIELTPNLRLAGQILSRKVGEVEDGSLKVDLLLLDYKFHSSQDMEMGVRLGRVKNSIGLYNTSRDIPSARPGTKIPESVSFESFRDAVLSVDGINLYGSAGLESGFLTWEVFRGNKKLENPSVEYYMFGSPVAQGDINDVELSGLSLSFSPNKVDGLKLGASLLNVYLKLDDAQSVGQAQSALEQSDAVQSGAVQAVTPVAYGGLGLDYGSLAFFNYLSQVSAEEAASNPNKYMTSMSLNALYTLLSVQYSYEDWLLTSEYMRVYIDVPVSILGNRISQNLESEGYYLQAEWFGLENLSLYGRYEEMYLDSSDRRGDKFSFDYNPTHGYGTGWTLGAKWHFAPNWMLLGEVSVNQGTAWLPSYPGIEKETIREYWNTYSVAMSFQF